MKKNLLKIVLLINVLYCFFSCDNGLSSVTEISGIDLNIQSFNLSVNAMRQIEVIFIPAEAVPVPVSWSSSNSSVVTVSGDGVVEAIALGSAVITATTTDGKYSSDCTVTVDSELQRVYVDINASNPSYGDTWATAFSDLQDAIAFASDRGIPEIWVADGKYVPTSYPNGTESKHFSLKNYLTVYGGFSGGETSLEERDYNTNETILIGNAVSNYTSTNLFYHPASAALDATAILDGFIIIGTKYGEGYGMYNIESSPSIKNCTFKSYDNSEVRHLYYGNSQINILNCTFNNIEKIYFESCTGEITDSYFGESWDYPWVMSIYNSDIALNNCELNNNFASSSSSPVMYLEKTKITIDTCIFDGICMDISNSTSDSSLDWSLNITDSTFTNGVGSGYAQSLISFSGGLTQDVVIQNSTFSSNVGYDSDAAALTLSSVGSITIDGCNFYDNLGNFGIVSILQVEDPQSAVLSNCEFSGNTGSGGGAVRFQTGYADVLVDNCIFSDNNSTTDGGAIYLMNVSEVKFSSCQFNNNSAINGGAVYSYMSWPPFEDDIMFDSCSFSGNTANDKGGAIYYYNIFGGAFNSSFENNSAIDGGAIYYTGTVNYPADAKIERVKITNNNAENGGGIYAVDETDLYIVSSLFTGNTASTAGGAVYSENLETYLLNSTVADNSSDVYGGGIYSTDSSITYIQNSIIWNNSSANGSDIYMLNGTSPVTIDGQYSLLDTTCILSDNDSYDTDYTAIITEDPLFTSNYEPGEGSPAINAGSNTLLSADDIYDLNGNTRINGTVDIGAFEF